MNYKLLIILLLTVNISFAQTKKKQRNWVKIGETHFNAMNYEAALPFFENAGKAGNATAQYYLGLMNEEGKGVEKSGLEALFWYKKSAKKAEPRAESKMGDVYRKGLFKQVKSEEKAKVWYSRAAEQGLLYAQLHMAHLILRGNGMSWYYDEALYWYEMAALQGDKVAQFWVGLCYEKRKGEPNLKKAIHWYKLSCKQGYKNGCIRLEIASAIESTD